MADGDGGYSVSQYHMGQTKTEFIPQPTSESHQYIYWGISYKDITCPVFSKQNKTK